MPPEHPISDSYWVQPGRLLAGEYPFSPSVEEGRAKLRILLAAGIDSFVDLTEDGEHGLLPYAPALPSVSKGRYIRHRRQAIQDMDVPAVEQLNGTLDLIDRWLAQGRRIYVHCFGGIGRTGTVAGCHLVRHGHTGAQALEAIRRRRRGTPDGGIASPETEEQRELVLGWQALDAALARRSLLDEAARRWQGCLLAGAVGDALGAPVEFFGLAEIRERHGEGGLREMEHHAGRVGTITDDTQMTLFTLEGLLRAVRRAQQPGSWDPLPEVHRAYLRWLHTQGSRSRHAGFLAAQDGWLVSIPSLHARRAPGSTCLEALQQGHPGTVARPGNDSKGCGGVMRVAPAGLVASAGQDPFQLGCDIAALTHGHPSGYLAAGCLAAIVHHLLQGRTLLEAVQLIQEPLREQRAADECLGAIGCALERAGRTAGSAADLEALGQGWVAEEALAMSLYSALVAEDMEHGLRLAVNHSGDSDSTGAITGNLLGALWGREAIPTRWLECLELRDEIELLVEDGLRLLAGHPHPGDEERYPVG